MKFIAKNIITILSLLVTVLVSISAYAYRMDIKNLSDKITIESELRKQEDIKLRNDYQTDMREHQERHKDDKEDRILRDEKFYIYLDQRFDDMEKLINNKR